MKPAGVQVAAACQNAQNQQVQLAEQPP